MKIFDAHYLNSLTVQAKKNQRLRQHQNIHQSYQDSCQRLFNAIEYGSYIRPHRHSSNPREELLIAIRGSLALVTFDDEGAVRDILRFGTEQYGGAVTVGVEVESSMWHTVLALEPGCVLLEVKAGPFDSNQPKDFAPWAPEEGTCAAETYLKQLMSRISE